MTSFPSCSCVDRAPPTGPWLKPKGWPWRPPHAPSSSSRWACSWWLPSGRAPGRALDPAHVLSLWSCTAHSGPSPPSRPAYPMRWSALTWGEVQSVTSFRTAAFIRYWRLVRIYLFSDYFMHILLLSFYMYIYFLLLLFYACVIIIFLFILHYLCIFIHIIYFFLSLRF